MIPGVQEIKALALKYSKKQLANMAQTGLIDPQKAVMAGMMRDRIAKEDMQPPSTTVAQDVLGLAPQQQMAPQQPQMGMQPPPPMAQARPQPQMPPPQMGAPVEQPPVMAASGGVTSLPVEMADYAGGGIVAFADRGLVEDEAVYDPITGVQISGPAPKPYRRELPPGTVYEPSLISDIFSGPIQTTTTTAPTAPAAPAPAPLPPVAQSRRNAASGDGSVPRPPTAPNLGKSTLLDAPTLPTYTPVTAPTIPSAPTLAAFDPNAVKIKGAELKMPTIDKLEDITKEREKAQKAAGYNKDLTEDQLKRVEGKKGELSDLKSRAGGEALMQFGLGLIGARKGEEGQRVRESGQAALASYKGDMKELRDARDKLDERAEALRVADNQAKKTNSAADIAKRDAQVAKYDAAQLKVYEVESSLAEKNAMVSANVYNTRAQQEMESYKTGVTAGQQQYATEQQAASKHFGDMVQATTQLHNIKQQATTAERGHQIEMYRAQLAHSASMYNSSVIKQAGLDERRSRTLIEASDSFIKSNKDSMYYADKPQLLQEDALNYAHRVEREFMGRKPGGTAPETKQPQNANRPSLDQFQR